MLTDDHKAAIRAMLGTGVKPADLTALSHAPHGLMKASDWRCVREATAALQIIATGREEAKVLALRDLGQLAKGRAPGAAATRAYLALAISDFEAAMTLSSDQRRLQDAAADQAS